MAYTKIIKVQTRLDKAVNYALNSQKTSLSSAIDYAMNKDKNSTEETILESAINCLITHPYQDMMETKKNKKKTDGILGYHIIQSFAPNETEPITAHTIGVEFAQRCFGKKYQVVVSTHLDRGHLHNHIVINSVSFVDGKKYKSEFNTYYNVIRKTSDDVCREYNLSIISPKLENKSLTYIEWLGLHKGKTTWQSIIRDDINTAIKNSLTFGEFLVYMEHMGYQIKQGKYISFRPYGKERFSRGYKLGENYTEDMIRARIDNNEFEFINDYAQTTLHKPLKPKKTMMSDIERSYWRWMYQLGLVKKRKSPPKMTKYLKEELLKFDKYTNQQEFLKQHSIVTQSEFYDYMKSINKSLNDLYNQLGDFNKVLKQNKTLYTALKDRSEYKKAYELFNDGYTLMNKEAQLYTKAMSTLKSNGFVSSEEIMALENEKSNVYEQIANLKIDIRFHKKEKNICSNIIDTMEHMKEKQSQIEKRKHPMTKERK